MNQSKPAMPAIPAPAVCLTCCALQAVADAMRIQYGGSANDKNCHELGACEDIDGFLVGGACKGLAGTSASSHAASQTSRNFVLKTS